MNHPPDKQLDDFAVWSVELDFSVMRVNGVPVAVVGHDEGPGTRTCWGYLLADFLRMLRTARVLKYRPIFINLDVKSWGEFTDDFKFQQAFSVINEVFSGDYVDLKEYVNQHGGRYPTIPELAGKAVFYVPNDPEGGLRGSWADGCTTPREVERSIESGATPEDSDHVGCSPDGCRVLRLDQYQADWTFQYGVPPNPICVDGSAQPPWTVTDSEGDSWFCPSSGDVSHGQRVGEQGTYRFPYRTVRRAVDRALGKTTPTPAGDLRRTGYGWTVLITPGSYPETLKIDIPLWLRRDERGLGPVVIGR